VSTFWSSLDFLNILFYLVFACFFIVQSLRKNYVPLSLVLISILIALPPFILTIAGLAVGEFDETNCEMAGNDILALYKLIFEWSSITVIGSLGLFICLKSGFTTNCLECCFSWNFFWL
jgi:hypothetical protein